MRTRNVWRFVGIAFLASPGVAAALDLCWEKQYECISPCGAGGSAAYCEDNSTQVGLDGDFVPVRWRWEVMDCYAFTTNLDVACDAPLPPFWEWINGCTASDGDCCMGHSTTRSRSDGQTKWVPFDTRPCDNRQPGIPGGSL